jgi:membrane protease YdiL (CAAX protease family)
MQRATSTSALCRSQLLAVFWWRGRHSRTDIGFTWGNRSGYVLAVLHPVLVMGCVLAGASAAGAFDASAVAWSPALKKVALVAAVTLPIAAITEEGFFRGWLWASLSRGGLSRAGVVVVTSLAFSAWHISAIVLETGFDVPAMQVPVYLANAVVMGVAWASLRWVSGSILVASLGHALWNGAAYALFGFGEKVGALGIVDTRIWSPEVGVAGLVVNSIVTAGLVAFAVGPLGRRSQRG